MNACSEVGPVRGTLEDMKELQERDAATQEGQCLRAKAPTVMEEVRNAAYSNGTGSVLRRRANHSDAPHKPGAPSFACALIKKSEN